jgi:hypothetical protein
MSDSIHTKVHNMIQRLNAERIKHGVDYCVMVKYGQAHLLTHPAWKDTLLNQGVPFATIAETVDETA